jgi:N-acetylmuramoyl-L-alanine amidase
MIRLGFLERVQRLLLAVLLIVVLSVLSLSVHAAWTWHRHTQESARDGLPTVAPVEVEGLPPDDRPLIGIVVGHWENDPGAVCPDGLTEIEINLDVAERVFALLSQSGYRVDLLPEFSPSLAGYQAAALVSIHTDSCNVPEATGFKVARVSSSMLPEIEDRLVACLIDHYGRATGLAFHRNSITFDMTEYHAFFEIAPETPAAIIEIGFMAADRQLLTRKPNLVAQGIYQGIACFVQPP